MSWRFKYNLTTCGLYRAEILSLRGRSIAYFIAPDLSGVEILCGGCAELSCNKTYTITDTIKKGIDCYSVFYFDKLNKVYSRKLRTQNRTYMYENISTKRKAELDYVFDLIEKESKNNN